MWWLESTPICPIGMGDFTHCNVYHYFLVLDVQTNNFVFLNNI